MNPSGQKSTTCGHELPDPPYKWTNLLQEAGKPTQVYEHLMCEACFNDLMAAPWMRASIIAGVEESES